MADQHANFAISSVASAPSPATTGTSLTVAAGEGTRFPVPPFNATVWPVGSSPTSANAEIVRVTARSTDTLTITRAQEGTSARSIGVGDQLAATITAKTLTDVETDAASRLRYQGAWSASTAYAVNDIVSYSGQLYVCTTANAPASTATLVGSVLQNSQSSSVTAALPTGTVSGDLAVVIAYSWQGGTPTLPSGYTIIATPNHAVNSRYSVLGSKTLTSADIATGSVTATATQSQPTAIALFTLRNAAGVNNSYSFASSVTAPPVTPTGNGVVLYVSGDVADFGAASASVLPTLANFTTVRGGTSAYVYEVASGTATASQGVATSGATFTLPGNYSDPISFTVPVTGSGNFPTGSFTSLAAGASSRATATATTASLASGATDNATTVSLAAGYRLYSIATSKPARVRLYDTAAHQTADLSRAQGTDPSASAGVILDYATSTAATVYSLSPLVDGASLETTPSASIPMTVTNNDTTTGAVTVSLVFLRTE